MINLYGQVLKDFNLHLNGVGNLGKAKTVALPKLEFKKEEQDLGGMAGAIEVPVNLEKMKASFSTADLDPYKLAFVGLVYPARPVLTFRGSIMEGGVELPVIAVIGGSLDADPNMPEKGKTLECKFDMSVDYFMLVISGVVVCNTDKIHDIVMINGVDRNLATRINIG